jgi:hypothetical protein
MADEQVESAATETETEVSLETPDASAETENTEGDKGPKTVPYARFQEVIKDKNETKKQLDELTESYQELAARLPEPKEEPAADAEIPEPPAGLSPMQRVQWLVDQGVERALKKKGLSLDDLATVATTAPEASREAMYAKWSRECAKHKIDPEDKRAQRLCQGFIAGEQNPDLAKVVEEIAGLLPKTAKVPGPTKVETDGVTSTMTVKDFLPRDKKEATEAARKGHRAPAFTTEEILQRKRAARGK